jgi:hypothetical protein
LIPCRLIPIACTGRCTQYDGAAHASWVAPFQARTMSSVQLILGAGYLDRIIPNADELLRQYRADTGCWYLDYESSISKTILMPEDLTVTLLVNSQVGWRAFRSLQEHGATIDLSGLPNNPLEQTTSEERRSIATLIAEMATWPGFAASVATKVLHKKRPDLIPILDNQAIFGAYMSKDWPGRAARRESVRSADWIFPALDWIAFDIIRPENTAAWEALHTIEPTRTRIQLFDSVWWMHFRNIQPVKGNSPSLEAT